MSTRPVLVLVEDSPLDAEIMQRVLSRAKVAHPVKLLRDGDEAWAYLSALESLEGVAVLLLDLNLPRRNGLEVLADLSLHPLLQQLPVVLFVSSELDQERAEKLGHPRLRCAYKPLPFADLTSLLDQLQVVPLERIA